MIRKLALACAVFAVSSLPGCSFIFSKGPPPGHRDLPFLECSTNYAPPVLDTVWGALNGIGALRAFATAEKDWNLSTDRSTTIGIGLAWVAVSGLSAYYGYTNVGKCQDARDDLLMRSQPRARQNDWVDREGAPAPPPPRHPSFGRPRPDLFPDTPRTTTPAPATPAPLTPPAEEAAPSPPATP
jgi:hypothetical protein